MADDLFRPPSLIRDQIYRLRMFREHPVNDLPSTALVFVLRVGLDDVEAELRDELEVAERKLAAAKAARKEPSE